MIPRFLLVLCLSFSCDAPAQINSSVVTGSSNPLVTAIMEHALNESSKISGLRSLMVYYQGDVIAEHYFKSYDADSLDHLRSVTKSVVSILIGIAIDQGLIKDINDPIGSYLFNHQLTLKQAEITIAQLLTMSSGMDWALDDDEHYRWSGATDHMHEILRRKVIRQPGTVFNYNTGDSHLLSVLLTDASGMNTAEFAEQNLFAPLGIKDYRWNKYSGYYSGAASLELSPNSMLRIGQMMKDGGTYKGQRIVSQDWVSASTNIQMPLSQNPQEQEGYGYLWWSLMFKDHQFYAAKGYGGQNIMVVPDIDLVVVTTARWNITKKAAAAQQEDINRLFADHIAIKLFLMHYPEYQELMVD